MKPKLLKPVVVGGIPEPIGGVTSFVYRLAERNMVSEVVDIYTSRNKVDFKNFSGRYSYVGGVLKLFLCFLNPFKWSRKFVHFNFSTPRSLVVFLLFPKFGRKFLLTLHHGVLKDTFFSSLVARLALKKIDKIYAINYQQAAYYKNNAVDKEIIKICSTYVEPFSELRDDSSNILADFCQSGDLLFIASGFPESYYNHDWCINALADKPSCKLVIFLYGKGDMYEYYKNYRDIDNVKFVWGSSQDEFNSVLMHADYYLRPSARDSFGIAVADAACFGAKVIASDVCKRFPGVYLFKSNDYADFLSVLKSLISPHLQKKMILTC